MCDSFFRKILKNRNPECGKFIGLVFETASLAKLRFEHIARYNPPDSGRGSRKDQVTPAQSVNGRKIVYEKRR